MFDWITLRANSLSSSEYSASKFQLPFTRESESEYACNAIFDRGNCRIVDGRELLPVHGQATKDHRVRADGTDCVGTGSRVSVIQLNARVRRYEF